MRIAVVGGGYCGLAAAWYLSGFAQVTVFDPEKQGKASCISTGLLHPFLGTRPRLSWNGFSALEKTKDFFDYLRPKSPTSFFRKTGVFKPILYDKQIPDFRKAYEKFEEIDWVHSFHETFHYPFVEDLSGIFIPDGYTVFSEEYLRALEQDCLQKGMKRVYLQVQDLKELDEFDHIILATGSFSHLFSELAGIEFDRVKGQALLCPWLEGCPTLPVSIIGQGHICMLRDKKYCVVGSTYEHEFVDEDPSEDAMSLLDRVQCFFPQAKNLAVKEIRAGVRIYRKKSHLPLVMRMTEKLWSFTAIGSRGLLYHHFLAELLAEAIRKNDDSILPADVQIKRVLV